MESGEFNVLALCFEAEGGGVYGHTLLPSVPLLVGGILHRWGSVNADNGISSEEIYHPLLMLSVARTGLLAMHQLPGSVTMPEKPFSYMCDMGLLDRLE